jgi:hypothetical protein
VRTSITNQLNSSTYGRHPIFESVRQHLQQGETGAALQTMITYLETEGKQTELLRTLRVVQASYNNAKQQELKGILAFQEAQREYSKVNDTLFTALDDLSAGRPTHTSVPGMGGHRQMPWRWIGGGALLVAAVAAFFIFRNPGHPTPAASSAGKPCPEFRPADYRIMLIPFVNLSGDTLIRPSISIQMRIRQLTKNNNMSTDVEILPGHTTELPDFVRAEQKGKECNADLVVWGQFEKVDDSLQVDVHYVFTKGDMISGHTDFQPFKSLSALQKSGKSSGLRSLDDAVLSLCSIMAVHAGRPEVAEKWLGKIKDTSEKDDSLIQAISQVKENRKRTAGKQ